MAILRPSPCISTKDLTYVKETKTFVTEDSDLGSQGYSRRLWGRVYDDACDEGCTLVSHKTGKEIVFAYDGEDRDASGEDIAGWRFVCVTPGFKDLKFFVIND